MFKALDHLKSKDKRALSAFLGIALLCFLYFASGILVTYVSSPGSRVESADEGRGFLIRVLGFQTHASAEKLGAALRERNLPVEIESDPVVQGYLIKVGPLSSRNDVRSLTDELHSSGYNRVNVIEICPPGTPGCNPVQQGSSAPRND